MPPVVTMTPISSILAKVPKDTLPSFEQSTSPTVVSAFFTMARFCSTKPMWLSVSPSWIVKPAAPQKALEMIHSDMKPSYGSPIVAKDLRLMNPLSM